MSILSDNLGKALDDVRDELVSCRVLEDLKRIIEDQIKHIKTTQKIDFTLDDVSSRIKSTSSFKEKFARKNYQNEWKLSEHSSKEECIEAIRQKLGDLIGVRINCFFRSDEKIFYTEIIKFLQDNPYSIKLPENYSNDITTLKTGDKLYKVSCQHEYTDAKGVKQPYFFELQIKCMVHNL